MQLKSTKPMRDRLRELSHADGHDEYDRAVLCVVDDLEAILASQYEAVEQAIDRMGWPEINAFNKERSKGQSIYEDAGGFVMRCMRRLFGLPSPDTKIVSYQEAARAMVEHARKTA